MWVKGDYHIGFSINDYSNANYSLSNGACCNGTSSCVEGGCRTTLRLCFRDTNHLHSDTESSCVLLVRRENSAFFVIVGSTTMPIQQYYPVRSVVSTYTKPHIL